MLTRKWLMGCLKAQGYNGPETEAEVSKFIGDAKITDEDGNSVDWKSAYANNVLTFDVPKAPDADARLKARRDAATSDNATKANKVDAAETKAQDDGIEKKWFENVAPEQRLAVHKRMAIAKAYNRKANDPNRLNHDARENAKKSNANLPAFSDYDNAEQFGSYLRMAVAGPHRDYPLKSWDKQVLGKAMSTFDNTVGGAWVPPPGLDSELTSLKETRGVARNIFRVSQLPTQTFFFPRRTAGLTVYSPQQGTAVTASDVSTDNFGVTAQDLWTLTAASLLFLMDSNVSATDEIAEEIAYAFANTEDEMCFNGTGAQATYFGAVGIRSAIKNLSSTIADIAGLIVGSGNLYSELDFLTDVVPVCGRLPQYAAMRNPKWVCHREFYYNVLVKEMLTQGGSTAAEARDGLGNPTMLGYPVQFAQVMPRIEGNSQVCLLFGDFQLAGRIGEMGGVSIATSEHLYFDKGQVAIRGMERFGFTAHDVGNQSSTAASRIPGPVVGLITAAS